MGKPLTVYFSDNNSPEIYKLTKEQLQDLADQDAWEAAEKFKVSIDTFSAGYAPDWLLKLAELADFEVDSI